MRTQSLVPVVSMAKITICLLLLHFFSSATSSPVSTIMLDSSYDKKQRKQRKKQGKTYQKQAVELVNGPGDGLREALPYFRASTRSNPNNAQYLNNLGVTEMRLGMFEKAKGRFLRVLNDLDPENEIAVENIEDLKKLVSEEEYVKMEPRDVNGEDLPQVRILFILFHSRVM